MTLLEERRAVATPGAGSRPLRFLPGAALLVDVLAIGAAVTVGVLGRDAIGYFHPEATVRSYLDLAGPLLVATWLLCLWGIGAYRRDLFGVGTDEYKRVLHATLTAAGLGGVACYLAGFELSRGFFLLTFAVGALSLILGRGLLRRVLYRARTRDALCERVVIAGTQGHVDEIAAVLRREAWLGYRVVGALVPASLGLGVGDRTRGGTPVIGSTDHVLPTLEAYGAEVVFLAGGALDSSEQLRRIVWALEDRDVQVVVAPSVTDVAAERIKVRPVGGLPLMHLGKPRALAASRAGKRVFDILGALALLAVFSPLFALAAISIKRYDGGPVLFAQSRTGRGGTVFRCLKFRTMVENAEDLLPALVAQHRHTTGLFKLRDDPRVTRPGRWLRRYSVDELPQLVNVLKGEMSLVGPRPPLPSEVATYEADAVRRLRVRPGMTGLWQVSGRADLSFDEAIRLDLYYVDNWSMLQDLTILARTLGAVVAPRGAY